MCVSIVDYAGDVQLLALTIVAVCAAFGRKPTPIAAATEPPTFHPVSLFLFPQFAAQFFV